MGNTAQAVSAVELAEAADRIRSGGIVAFPTETFYGLAVDPFNASALERLFLLKDRASDKPVLCLIGKLEGLDLLVKTIPPHYQRLLDMFWPGPLTMVFDGINGLPGMLTDDRGTVGVRCSSHPVARELAIAAGGVITGTSANPSGMSAAVNAGQVAGMFPEGIDQIIDGGPVPGGSGSTIIGLEGEGVKLIRDGQIPLDKIREAMHS
jgi:L-threonylcarbamoyladenylate synthase